MIPSFAHPLVRDARKSRRVPSYIRGEAREGENVGARAALTASQRLFPLL